MTPDNCPYEQYVTDGCSDTKVENQLYRAWHEGYAKGYADGQLQATREDRPKRRAMQVEVTRKMPPFRHPPTYDAHRLNRGAANG